MLGALLGHLPRDSALAIVENGGAEPFSLESHLLADLWVLTAGVNSKKGKGPKDHPIREKQRTALTAVKGRSRRAAYERVRERNRARIAGRTTT